MAVLVLQPDATAGIDTYMKDILPTNNFGTGTELWIGFGAGERDRILIKFADLAQVPAGSKVISARLEFTNTNPGSLSDHILAYRLKRAWTEGGASWDNWAAASPWTTPGASHANDRESTSVGTTSPIPDGSQATNEKLVIVFDPRTVEEMIPGGSWTNNGWLLDAPLASADLASFASSDHATATNRPMLTLEYLPVANRLNRYYHDLLGEQQEILNEFGVPEALALVKPDEWMELGGLIGPSTRIYDSLVRDPRFTYVEGRDYTDPGSLTIQGGREDIGQNILSRIVKGSNL